MGKHRREHRLPKKRAAWVDRDRREYRRAVDQLISQFRANGCQRPGCAEKHPCCLTAHHKDPRKKSFGISRAIAEMRVSPERIKIELRKCLCLCHNDHAKLHAGEWTWQEPEELKAKEEDGGSEPHRLLPVFLRRAG